MKSLLSLLTVPYRAGSSLAALLPAAKTVFPKPVLSIGSVIAGGSGKTSFTHFLAERLALPVALLSHGYRSTKQGRVVGLEYGDEAFLLQKKLPLAKVFAGKDRVANAQLAVQEEVDYLLLDSGMQVRGLHKDLEIAVVHYDNLWEHWHYLPRGLLRASPYRLQECQAIVVHGVSSQEEFQKATDFLAKYSAAPLLGTNSFVVNTADISGKKVAAFTGIGHPARFYQMIESVGGEIVHKKTLADHEPLLHPERFLQEAERRGAERVVTTEKDLLKVASPEIIALKIEMRLLFGEERFTLLLNRIKTLIMLSHDRQGSRRRGSSHSSQTGREYPQCQDS